MFIFSSVFDGLIVVSYFVLDNNIGKRYNKFIYGFFATSMVNAIMYELMSGLGLWFQLIFILYSGLVLGIIFNVNIKRSIFSVFKVMCLMLIIEASVSILLTVIFKINMFSVNFDAKTLALCMPQRILEFIIIYFGKKKIIKKR